ncbi:hypothetical protein P5G51_005370 [Virgibacillus sp. 179-BFC.A HS]|uniref:Helix-turn-helix domain-containing protein n=1 Tax=Tigheibacillus jepli TaxID=3035914 RepID=A0ABU5CEZ0_9BACI|nr:hypothetical protein [Virgibacillus sp. 179-BFC.A HS]MDY0404902.1 hypothetical protein [Virgibacillus sp. 179-BFC.A HS]
MSINLSRREQNTLHHWKNGQRTQYRLKWRATIIWELAHENDSVTNRGITDIIRHE